MNRQERIESFLDNLKRSTGDGHSNEYESNNSHYSHTSNDLFPYKSHQAWPGRRYKLIGNSFNVESKIIDAKSNTRRRACIAVVLEKGKGNCNCVSIEDALKYSGFVEILSRFEFDWLSKQPPSTLIGPAYDGEGELLTDSFAVWRREALAVKEIESLPV